MDKEPSKPWEKPWTTDEIREHSPNWNLAGDSGLLNHLQQFSQNLLAQTHATEVALDKLLEDLKTTSTNVQNATNNFLFLANTQFVENRVYDDDEKETPPEEKKDGIKPSKTKEEQEAEIFQNVKQALDMGLALLDTHFEAVEVPASDSEEEESSASVGRLVLKPKNPYFSRPLPYIIGSREFMEDDRVGLGDISSDTEGSPDQNVVQSSESDDEMEHDELLVTPKRPMTLSSSETENSEPESDRSGTVAKQKKLRTGSSIRTLEGEEDGEMFGQESPPEADDFVAKGDLKSALSDELSSKLGIASSHHLPERGKEEDIIFVPSSEPEDDSGLFGKANRSFTEKQGLFDDLDDWQGTSNSLWRNSSSNKPVADPTTEKVDKTGNSSNVNEQNDVKQPATEPNMNTTANVNDDRKICTSTPQGVASKLRETGLFSPKNNTEDLFGIKHKDTAAATSSSLFGNDDLEEDDLFAVPSQPSTAQSTKKKLLPGAVPVFSDVNLFGDLSPVVHHDSTAENGTSRSNVQSMGSSLQQESSSGIGNTLHSISKRENENMSQRDAKSENEKSSTFDSQKIQEELQNVATSTKLHETIPSKSSLFKEENESDSLFDKPHSSDQAFFFSRNMPGSKVSSSNLKTKTKKPVSLFDDSDSGDDELLFSSTSSTSSRSRRSQGSADILAGTLEKKTLPKKGLFEDNVLFGSGSKDEPEVDIFSSTSDFKPKSGFLSKDHVLDGDDITGDTSGGTKKISSSIFDNIDDVDDIFAIPKITVEKSHDRLDNTLNNTVRSSLFSDDSTGKLSFKFQDKKENEEPNSVPKEIHDNDVSSVPGTIDISTRLISADSSSQLNKNSLQNVEIEEKVTKNAKPTVSQKPKVPMKPTPSSLTSQESKEAANIPRVDSKVERNQYCKNQDILTVSASVDNEQSNSTLQVQKVCENQISSVSHVKPEPPRTLNIRKTTDILFESPSNEDDDLFESSQSEKSSMENDSINKMSNNNNNINNTLSSSNFSKLLEGFNFPTPVTSLRNEAKVDSSNNSSISNKTNFTSERSDVHPANKPVSQHISSPSKLFIDPRALLPRAKPPNTTITADKAVDFDKPAETTSMLHSAGKERVKIQVKRRPQTRKARQEALRASSLEYDTIDAALISQITNNNNNSVHTVSLSASSSSLANSITPKIFEPDNVKKSLLVEKPENDDCENSSRNDSEGQSSISESDHLVLKADAYKLMLSDGLSGNSNPLSPLTDEEDLFAVPHDLPFDETSNKEVSNDSKNIFGGAPVLSPLDMRTEDSDYNTQSFLVAGEKKDDFMSRKRDSNTHSTLGNTLEDGHILQKDGGISDLSDSLVVSDRTDCDNILSVSKREDEFTKPSDSKRLQSGRLESAIDRRGLFDDCDDLDKVDDKDDDDDDLFSTTKFGKKGKKRTIHRNVSPTTLFSPVATSNFENVVTAGLHINQSPSSSTEPSQSKILTQTDSDINPDFLHVVSTNISDKQESSSDSSSLLPKRISDSSQRNKMDDAKEAKSFSSVKVKDQVKSNAQQERVKSHIDSLFGDDSTESDDLFGSSSVPKKPVAGSDSNSALRSKLRDAKESIFDDGDDDDIFTIGLSKNKGPKSDALIPKHENSMHSAEESDDLFSKKNANGGNKGTKSSSAQKVQSFEDPLMVFNK